MSHTVELAPPAATPKWMRWGFWVCVAIAVAVVIRRLVALWRPSTSGPPQMVQLDAAFAGHAALSLAHILPALAYVLLLPFAISRRFGRSPWVQRALLVLALAVAATAYAMSAYSVGGWVERSAVLLFNSLFLFCTLRAEWHRRRGQAGLARRWMLRSVAVLLGIATTRPVMGVFFATSRWTHLGPQQFFGLAFWIGFSVNAVVMEGWLRSSRYALGQGTGIREQGAGNRE